jgi:DNA-binding response OmpR family regulator
MILEFSTSQQRKKGRGVEMTERQQKAVLLVDDEEPILISLGDYLQRGGFFVKTAKSGEDALAVLPAYSFDLVITDLVMDGISGLEVLQKIKKTNSEIGVFILTGQGNMNRAIEALRSGADDFLLKPYDPDELILRMKCVFTKQEALRKIKIYEKFLPICMYCKKIRDDTGEHRGSGKWLQLEEYLRKKSGVNFSHGCCPECYDAHKDNWL